MLLAFRVIRLGYEFLGWDYDTHCVPQQMTVAGVVGYFSPKRCTRPTVVAHSLGGYVALTLGSLSAERFTGIVICDAAVRPPEYYEGYKSTQTSHSSPKIYPKRIRPEQRFRLLPPQTCHNTFILHHIAR